MAGMRRSRSRPGRSGLPASWASPTLRHATRREQGKSVGYRTLRGSSAGSTYSMPPGQVYWTCRTASPLPAQARRAWLAWYIHMDPGCSRPPSKQSPLCGALTPGTPRRCKRQSRTGLPPGAAIRFGAPTPKRRLTRLSSACRLDRRERRLPAFHGTFPRTWSSRNSRVRNNASTAAPGS